MSEHKNRVVVEKEVAEKPVERVAEAERPAHWFKPGVKAGPGRAKGQPNKVTRGIKEAVMAAIQPGECHPEGLKGWLVERATGGIEDRKIFAAVVSRVIPVEVTGADGGPVKIDLGWLGQRRIGYGDVVDVTPTAQEPGRIGQVPAAAGDGAGGSPDSTSDAGDDEVTRP